MCVCMAESATLPVLLCEWGEGGGGGCRGPCQLS